MEENVTTEELNSTELSKADKKRLKKEAKARAKEQKIKENKKNKKKKAIVTTSFFLTLLALIAGLLVPLFDFTSEGDLQSKMMVRYIPAMFNNVIYTIAKKQDVIPEFSNWFKPYPLETTMDIFISFIGALYAVVCAIAVLMCIPVFLGSKKKNTSANCALATEVLTVIVISCYIAFKTYGLIESEKLEWSDYNLFIPYGVALLMAIIQSITSKGSIGVSKTIAVLLSAIGVVAIMDITLFIPALKSPLEKLCGLVKIKGVQILGSTPGFLLGSEDLGGKGIGMDGINILLSIIVNAKEMMPELAQLAAAKDGWKVIIVLVLLILIPLFTLLNLVIDIIGLGTGKKFNKKRQPCANKGSNAFALTRYILSFLFTGGLIAITFFIDDMNAGLYLYLLEIVLLISIINAAARTGADNARVKKGLPAPATEQQQLVIEDQAFTTAEASYEEQPAAPEYAEAYAQPTYEQPAYDQQAYQQQTYDPQAYQQQTYDQQYAQPAYDQQAYDQSAYQQQAYDQQYAQPTYEQPAYDQSAYQQQAYDQQAYQQPVYEQPLSDAELDRYNEAYNPAPAEPLTAPLEQPAEPTPTVYIYGGATDDFMDSLTDTEKVEFVEVFIKKSKGVVKGVPEYVIDSDNSDFFPAVFVHINRYRNIVSDALMSKLYKQLGKL